MSNNISNNILKQFIQQVNGHKDLTLEKAKELGIEEKTFLEADENDDNVVDIDEILDSEDLTEYYQAVYTAEQEKTNAVKDEDQEKEEQTRVKDKSQSKAK